jgi:hypothetical protein
MTYEPRNRAPHIVITRWQKKADYIVLTFSDGSGAASSSFRAYAPDVNSPRDLTLSSECRLAQWFRPARHQSLQAVLMMVDDPDNPRIDPSLVTWGTGGNQAIVTRFAVPQLYEQWEFTLSLPVLTSFDRLDGRLYT